MRSSPTSYKRISSISLLVDTAYRYCEMPYPISTRKYTPTNVSSAELVSYAFQNLKVDDAVLRYLITILMEHV